MQNAVPIASIEIGKRCRQDFGDIKALAESIRSHGLLHPVVITPDKTLIAGARRIAAVRELGWDDVPVRVIDIDSVVHGERAENQDRLDFTPSEAVAIWEAVLEEEKRQAKERQQEHGGTSPGEHSGKVSPSDDGRARDKAAKGTGRSGRTLEKASAIVKAAEADPERFGKLKDDMDRTGQVNGPYKRLVIAQKADAIEAEPPPLPSGPFRVIVADPPWPYEKRMDDPSHRAALPYPTMSIEQIKALDVGSIAHEDCILWLWVTNHHLREAFEVLDAWGFEQKTMLTWAKSKMSTGDWLRGKTEHCLLAVRGRPVVTLTNQTTLLEALVRGHSEKPDEFFALVEALCPAPQNGRVELFQRKPRPGWIGHGDEVLEQQIVHCQPQHVGAAA